MSKFFGISLLSISTVCYLLKNLYINIVTQRFLKESIFVLKQFYIEIESNKTYNQILKNMNTLKYFNNDFKDINILDEQFINKEILKKINGIFENLGKNSTVKEKSFIANNIEILNSISEDLKAKIDINSKSTVIMSISVGLMIFIVAI